MAGFIICVTHRWTGTQVRSVRHGERERDGSTSCLADWYQAITVDEEQRRHRDTHLLDGAHFVCTQALSGGCGYSLFVCTPRFPTLFAHVSCCCVSRLFAHTQHNEVKKPSSFCFAHQAVEQQRRHAHRDGTSTSAPSGCLHAHTHTHTHTHTLGVRSSCCFHTSLTGRWVCLLALCLHTSFQHFVCTDSMAMRQLLICTLGRMHSETEHILLRTPEEHF